MINKLATKITNKYIAKKQIEESEKEMYIYCFELLLSTIINLIMVLIVGVISKLIIEMLIFSVVFMCMRGSAGGYHAKTHIGCIIMLLLSVLVLVLILKVVAVAILFYVSIGLVCVASVLFIILSPVDSKNKKLDSVEKKRNRLKSIIYLSIFVVAVIIFSLFDKTILLMFTASYALSSVDIMLVLGRIVNLAADRKTLSPKIIKKM